MAEKRKLKAVYLFPVIAGCGLVGAGLGVCINIFGIFFTPIAEDLAIGRGRVAMLLTVYSIMQAVGGLRTPRLLQRLGIKKLVLLGTALQVGSTLLMAVCRSIYPMYALNALRGFASGTIGTVAVTIMLNYWFRDKLALMTSIALSFSGIVGAVLSPAIAAVIAAAGWRTALVTCAGCVLLLNAPALALPISLRPEDRGLVPYGESPTAGKTFAPGESKAPLYLPLFLVTIAFAGCNCFVTSISSHMPGIAESRMHAEVGAAMLSACMAANTGGKVALGWLIDRFGTRKSASLFILLIAVGAGCLFSARVPVLLLGATLYGLGYSNATLAVSTLSREMFGVENYARIYPKASFVGTVANAVGATTIGFIYDVSGTYRGALLLMLAVLAMALTMVQIAYPIKRRKKQRLE